MLGVFKLVCKPGWGCIEISLISLYDKLGEYYCGLMELKKYWTLKLVNVFELSSKKLNSMLKMLKIELK